MLSIIIVSYNTRDLLDQCLASLQEHCSKSEVIVVDNGSSDGSVEMVRSKHPQVELVDAKDNLGFAGANNRGIQKASGDYVLLLNSDTVVEDDSLLRCEDWLDDHPKVGALSPSLVGMDGTPQRAFHAFPSLKKRMLQAVNRRREIKVAEPKGEGWLAGTALMIRREALDQIGGELDHGYWMYWEDADTSAQLLSLGWEVREFPDAHILHYGGASGGGPDAARRSDLYAHYAWGEHRWFFKHRPIWESLTLWALDFVDIFRRVGRGLRHAHRRSELKHAQVLFKVLAYRLTGRRPPLPA